MILKEYEYRTEIDDLLLQFKKSWTSKKSFMFTPPDFTIKPPRNDQDESPQNVTVKIKFTPIKDLKWSFNINAAKDTKDNIVGLIQYNPHQFPGALKDLISELREMFRHELEHVAQDAFQDKWVKYVKRNPNDPAYYVGYLLQGNEIQAYLRGFETVMEHTGKTMEQVMDAWHKNNKANFRKDKYWQKVKGMWLREAKKMGLVDEGTILNNPSATYSRKAKKEKFNIKKLGIK